MASIRLETIVNLGSSQAWSALREVKYAHLLFAGVLIDGRVEGNVRTVTFANGMTVRERIIDISEEHRRVAYSVVEGTPMTHHNASMQIVPEVEGQCRFIWIADFLPDEIGGQILPLMEQGADALKRNLESGAYAKATARTGTA